MTWRNVLRFLALVASVANEAWVASLIGERIGWHNFQNEKACCVTGIIDNSNFWISFPWLTFTLVCACFAWTPPTQRWWRLILGAIAVSEASFIWSFYALYLG